MIDNKKAPQRFDLSFHLQVKRGTNIIDNMKLKK